MTSTKFFVRRNHDKNIKIWIRSSSTVYCEAYISQVCLKVSNPYMKWWKSSSKQFQVPTFYAMMWAIASHQLVSAFTHPTMWILWVRDQDFENTQSSRHCGTWRYRTSGVFIWWEHNVDDVNYPDQNSIRWCWIFFTHFMAWKLA